MAILMSFYLVTKYVCSLIFSGPLNFNIEILFWIFNGILFGPIIGSIFSIVCDTLFTFITSGIARWMIEYAIIAPLVSIIAWFFWKSYKENSKWTVIISITTIFILIASTLVIFFFQLLSDNFKYEGVKDKNIFPIFIYILISFLCISMVSFSLYCLILFKMKKEWKYIKWLHSLTLIIMIVIVFRWIWGPYAYLEYSRRFYSKNIDFAKQYPLSLFGIVTKSCLTIPLASMIVIPMISILEKFQNIENYENRFF